MLEIIDPDETAILGWDWAPLLGSDTIATSAWSVTPTGPTVNAAGTVTTTTTSTTMSGATLGAIYTLTNRIVTAAGETRDRAFTVRCHPR